MKARKMVKQIKENKGVCLGIVCSKCPLLEDPCHCTDEGALVAAEQWLQDHPSKSEQMQKRMTELEDRVTALEQKDMPLTLGARPPIE